MISPIRLRLSILLTLVMSKAISWVQHSSITYQHRPTRTHPCMLLSKTSRNESSSIYNIICSCHVRQKDSSALNSNSEGRSLNFKNQEDETLLVISLSVNDSVQDSFDDILNDLQSYIQSFPFAAILPVQPLTYAPKRDNLGVDLTFLRKKTQEKGSVDGGIEFRIIDSPKEVGDENDPSRRIEIMALRNSNGQSVSKVFSESVILKAFVKYITNKKVGQLVGVGNDDFMEKVSVESVYHKWM